MSGQFDAYHRWLGIPPHQQPPHHYRLLALELFEDDPEVIDDAAARQMAHVRSYQLGQHRDLSQKILNHLGEARACLMDADRKAAYDRQLRAELAAGGQAPSAAPLPTAAPLSPVEQSVAPAATFAPAGQPVPQPAPELPLPATPRRATHLANTNAPRKVPVWAVTATAAGLAVLLVAGLVSWLLQGSPAPETALALTNSANSELTTPKEIQPAEAPSSPGANERPILGELQDVTVNENEWMTVRAEVLNLREAGDVSFRLVQGAELGAQVSQTGEIRWRPREDQNAVRSSFPLTLRVEAAGDPQRSDEKTFLVHMREVNQPPTIDPVAAGQTAAEAGSPFRLALTARDADVPGNKLFWSISSGPSGATIQRDTGILLWTPPTTMAGLSQSFRVRVTDEAASFDEESFTVTVAAPLSPGNSSPLATPGTRTRKRVPGARPPRRRSRAGSNLAPQADFVDIKLPSGATFTTDLLEEEKAAYAQALKEDKWKGWIEARDRGNVLAARVQCDSKANFQGLVITYHPSQTIKTIAQYDEDERSGWASYRDLAGQLVYWATHKHDKLDGFCCLLEDLRPKVIQQWDVGRHRGTHLIERGAVRDSLSMTARNSSQLLAKASPPLRELLAKIRQIETEIRKDEIEVAKLADETVEEIRRRLMGSMSESKRRAAQERLNQDRARNLEKIRGLRRAGGL